ncbi:MAG: YbjN domain-containing protein [Leptolyngbya sp. SIO4C1]|nr:YbjN domain-containing protein [Leptolyngbya sp. SIO4C1]
MEFQSPAQKACYERIAPWMQELFGESAVAFEDEPLFIVTIGSAVASTRVIAWGEAEALITTRAYVVTDIEITPELSYYLLRANEGIYFGRFALDSEDDIVFEHSLVGSSCDRIELKHSVQTVVRLADDYDDEIVARWGGKRALDRWASAQ